jgi:hypothetical protein
MSRKSAKPHFYEIGTGMDSPGKFSRRHILRCGKCDVSVSFQPMSDEQIRKKAIHLGWDVGKTHAQHLCPKHAHAQKSYARPQSIVEVHDVSPLSPPHPQPQPVPVVEEFTNWFCNLPQSTRTLLFESVIKRIGEKELMDSLPKSERSTIKIVENPRPIIPDVDATPSEPDPEDIEVADMIFGKRKSA